MLRCECCSADTVLELVKNERLRATALANFWKSMRSDDTMACCETMIDCPLRAH
ncbi:hypothetical protein D3C85_1821240 [compost metagenome]